MHTPQAPATLKWLSIAVTALSASALLALSPPTRAQTPTPAPTGSIHKMRKPLDATARTQKRLDKLERSLNLQPGQQTAWGNYKAAAVSAANERATKMQQHIEQMKANNGQTPELTAPQRMEEHAKDLREKADSVSRMAQQTQALYQVLTPEQKTIFDLSMQQRHHHFGMLRHSMMQGSALR